VYCWEIATLDTKFELTVGRAGKALLLDGRSHAQGGKTGSKNGACVAADPEAIL
jgi:hypothetical protein